MKDYYSELKAHAKEWDLESLDKKIDSLKDDPIGIQRLYNDTKKSSKWGKKNLIQKESKIFKDIKNKSHMYFVHSYEFVPEDKEVISATAEYSSNIVCSVEKENIFGTQFHPEKSDKIGLKIINNFINL